MVKRVTGKVDGVEVILRNKGDRWEVPVPFEHDGEYVVEIMAEDEAGNIAYATKMLFIVNGSMIRQFIIPFDHTADLLPDKTTAYMIGDSYITVVSIVEYQAVILEKQYTASLMA